MSASEKLSALEGPTPFMLGAPTWRFGDKIGTSDQAEVLNALLAALPQIVAVVAAAEGEWAAWDACGYPEDLGPETRNLRDALAALDEALSGKVRDSKLTDRFDWNSRDGVTFDASDEALS